MSNLVVSSSDEFSELSGMDDEPSYDVSPTWAAMLGDGGERTLSRSSRRSLECSQVEINIIGTHLLDGHTVYVVQLSLTGVKSWEVQRRFRDFIYLDKELRKKFPHLKMPSLPPKMFWFSSTDPALVDERRDHLENYLKTLTFIQQIWTRNDLVLFLNDEANSMMFIWNFERMKKMQDTLSSLTVENKSETAKLTSDLVLARTQVQALQERLSRMEMLMLQQATGLSTQELSTEALRSLSGVGTEEVSHRLVAGLYDRPAEREAVDNKPPSSSSSSSIFTGSSPRDALQPSDQLILDQAIEAHISSGATLPCSAVVEVLHLANSDDTTKRTSLQNLGAKSPEQLRTVAVSLQLEEAVRLTKVLPENYDASTAAVISGSNSNQSDVCSTANTAAALFKEQLSHLSVNVNVKDKASFKQSNAENALYTYSSKPSVSPVHGIDGAAYIPATAAAWIPPLLHEMDEIIRVLVPSPSALAERLKVFRYVRNLVSASLGVQLFPVGSLVSQTFLPDADMETSSFIIRKDDESWFVLVNEALCMSNETRMSKYNSFDSLPSQSDEDINITNVSFVNGPIKKIRIMINSIGVEITMNQIGALYSEYMIERIDQFIGQNHLFKRSVLLVEMWCVYESPRYTQGAGSMLLRSSSSNDGSGSSDSNRLSSWAVTIMLISIFHLEGRRISHPLQALGHFLRIFSSFDWHKYAVSVKGKVYADDLRVCQDDAAAAMDVGHFFPEELLDKFYESEEDKIAAAAELAAAAVSAEEPLKQQSIFVGEVPILLDIPTSESSSRQQQQEGDDKQLLLSKQTTSTSAGAFPPPVSYFTKGIKYGKAVSPSSYQQGLITIIDPVRGNTNVAHAISVDGYQIITSALYEGYRSFQTMCESFVIARSPRNAASPQHTSATIRSSSMPMPMMSPDQQLTEQDVLKIIRILFANTQLKVVSWDPHFKKTVMVSDHHPTTAVAPSRSYLDAVQQLSTSKPLQRFPTLRSQPDDLEFSLRYAEFVLGGRLSRKVLERLVVCIITAKGSMPVGEIGKNIQSMTGCENLSKKLKEQFSGLKKALETLNSPYIKVGNEHPFNPFVTVLPEKEDCSKSDGSQSQALDHADFMITAFQAHVSLNLDKDPAMAPAAATANNAMKKSKKQAARCATGYLLDNDDNMSQVSQDYCYNNPSTAPTSPTKSSSSPKGPYNTMRQQTGRTGEAAAYGSSQKRQHHPKGAYSPAQLQAAAIQPLYPMGGMMYPIPGQPLPISMVHSLQYQQQLQHYLHQQHMYQQQQHQRGGSMNSGSNSAYPQGASPAGAAAAGMYYPYPYDERDP